MIEVVILVKLLMLLVKDGMCAVLPPSLQMRSMRFLQKVCGRYNPTSCSNENNDNVLYKEIVSCGSSHRLKLIL